MNKSHRLILAMREYGCSYVAIARHLSKQGRPWTAAEVKQAEAEMRRLGQISPGGLKLDRRIREYFEMRTAMQRLPPAHLDILYWVSSGLTYQQIARLIKEAPSLYHRGQKWTPKHIAKVHQEAKRVLGEFVV